MYMFSLVWTLLFCHTQVISVIRHLLSVDPDERPNMSDVVEFLRDILDAPDDDDGRASSDDDEGGKGQEVPVHEVDADMVNLFDRRLPSPSSDASVVATEPNTPTTGVVGENDGTDGSLVGIDLL